MTDTLEPNTELPRVEINISQKMIDRYAEVSGDFNPVHVDVEGMVDSEFGSTIAHGCIPMEPLFQGLAKALKRPDLPFGTRVDVRYRRPSRPGDTIHLLAHVAEPNDAGETVIEFSCANQHDETVLDGGCAIPPDTAG